MYTDLEIFQPRVGFTSSVFYSFPCRFSVIINCCRLCVKGTKSFKQKFSMAGHFLCRFENICLWAFINTVTLTEVLFLPSCYIHLGFLCVSLLFTPLTVFRIVDSVLKKFFKKLILKGKIRPFRDQSARSAQWAFVRPHPTIRIIPSGFLICLYSP